MALNRREFLHRTGLSTSVGATSLSLATLGVDAAGKSKDLKFLNKLEAATLAAFAELLVPGAKAAGIVDFVDSQLSGPDVDNLLMLRYLTVPIADFGGFYQAGLAACSALASAEFDGKSWAELALKEQQKLVQLIGTDSAKDWLGPPASFFQFVVRADASDVVYGTRDGFERMGMPHMAHIDAKSEW